MAFYRSTIFANKRRLWGGSQSTTIRDGQHGEGTGTAIHQLQRGGRGKLAGDRNAQIPTSRHLVLEGRA